MGAFTLIELLVVIAIIGLLAGVLIPTVVSARVRAKVHATSQQIDQIRVALVSYQTKYGDYPPTTLAPFGLRTNDVNSGVESLVACLSTTKAGGPYLTIEEKSLANGDDDAVSKNPTAWWFGDLQLREALDPFGRPFVYFHNRDYVKPAAASRYLFEGVESVCTPRKSAATSAYHNPDSFMIWSVGPDGVNQDGEDDDIGNW